MSSRREEIREFRRLKKSFPNADVSITVKYCTWCTAPLYQAYTSNEPEHYLAIVGSTKYTAKEAVDDVIEKARKWRQE